jgi:hypothetical protein
MARETREVWAKRVERWRDSGLTVKEFAAEIGVNANTLAGWRWRIGSGARRPAPAVARSSPAFVEVVAAPEVGTTRATLSARVAEPLELILRGGHRVRVPAEFDPAALRRLVDALEAR